MRTSSLIRSPRLASGQLDVVAGIPELVTAIQAETGCSRATGYRAADALGTNLIGRVGRVRGRTNQPRLRCLKRDRTQTYAARD
jgi:hypothetical protein